MVLLALTWGSSFILLKWSLEVFHPVQVFGGRMLTAAILLLPIAVREIRHVPRDKWKHLIVFAVVANIGTTLLYAFAQTGLSSSFNGVINSLTPIMTLLVGLLFFSQDARKNHIGGLLLGLTGSVILLLSNPRGEFGEINYFALIAVAATLANGFMGNLLKFKLEGLKIRQIASISFLIVLPVTTLVVFGGDFWLRVTERPQGFQALGYVMILGAFANALALIVMARLIRLSSPVFASLVTYLIPVVALSWGLVVGEVIDAWQIGALGLVFGGIYLTNRSEPPTPPGPP